MQGDAKKEGKTLEGKSPENKKSKRLQYQKV